ncbi:hypothetical protein MPC4_20147 [Methylocella tundrae]|uniref:Uncharacterized protein n=1 Tax=Methylocella tundrae TaxID=227605 RepID=A0A8B6M4J7_METTU|nr:hypothetical protein MPC4_20147 [Methylocella tundrae]
MMHDGWGTWIRTKIDGVRVRCSTVELSPTDPSSRAFAGPPGNRIYWRDSASGDVI